MGPDGLWDDVIRRLIDARDHILSATTGIDKEDEVTLLSAMLALREIQMATDVLREELRSMIPNEGVVPS